MLSYNGYLRFTLTSEPAMNLDLTSTPLIHIIANTVLHLHYTHSTTGPHHVQGDVLNVRLHEVSIYIILILVTNVLYF